MAATLTQAHCRDAVVARAIRERHAHVMSSAKKKNKAEKQMKIVNAREPVPTGRGAVSETSAKLSAPPFKRLKWSAKVSSRGSSFFV